MQTAFEEEELNSSADEESAEGGCAADGDQSEDRLNDECIKVMLNEHANPRVGCCAPGSVQDGEKLHFAIKKNEDSFNFHLYRAMVVKQELEKLYGVQQKLTEKKRAEQESGWQPSGAQPPVPPPPPPLVPPLPPLMPPPLMPPSLMPPPRMPSSLPPPVLPGPPGTPQDAWDALGQCAPNAPGTPRDPWDALGQCATNAPGTPRDPWAAVVQCAMSAQGNPLQPALEGSPFTASGFSAGTLAQTTPTRTIFPGTPAQATPVFPGTPAQATPTRTIFSASPSDDMALTAGTPMRGTPGTLALPPTPLLSSSSPEPGLLGFGIHSTMHKNGGYSKMVRNLHKREAPSYNSRHAKRRALSTVSSPAGDLQAGHLLAGDPQAGGEGVASSAASVRRSSAP